MENSSELKAIWLTAKTDNLPDSAEMMRVIRRYRVKKLAKLTALTVIALLLIAVMVRVVFVYKSTLLSTRIGEGLMMLAGLILVVTQVRTFLRFYNAKDYSNKEFIRFLEYTREQKTRYFKKTQVIAMSVCSAGLMFYIFEPVYPNLLYCAVAYSLLTAYILVMVFIIRPRTFRRYDKKLKNEILHFEALLNQIN
jgi:hypothetical protein